MAYPKHTMVQRTNPVPVDVPARVSRYLAFAFVMLLAALVLQIAWAPWAHALRPITITLLQNLDFGIVGTTVNPGTVVVDPATGLKTVTGGALDLGGVHTSAIFTVTGEKNSTFTIILPSQITIVAPGGGTAVVNAFTSSPSSVGLFNQQGQATLTVGASLNVSSVTAQGAYTAPFSVTVAY